MRVLCVSAARAGGGTKKCSSSEAEKRLEERERENEGEKKKRKLSCRVLAFRSAKFFATRLLLAHKRSKKRKKNSPSRGLSSRSFSLSYYFFLSLHERRWPRSRCALRAPPASRGGQVRARERTAKRESFARCVKRAKLSQRKKNSFAARSRALPVAKPSRIHLLWRLILTASAPAAKKKHKERSRNGAFADQFLSPLPPCNESRRRRSHLAASSSPASVPRRQVRVSPF